MRKLVSAVLIAFLSINTNAASVTLDLSNVVRSAAAFSVDHRGVTLSFFNPDLDGLFDSDSDGIAILNVNSAGSIFPDISSFQMSFDSNVRLLNYDIGYVGSLNEGDESFRITGSNGMTEEVGPFTWGGNFNNPFIALAGEVLSVSANPGLGGENLLQLYAITVETVELPSPPSSIGLTEPATFGLLALGLLGMGVARSNRPR